MQIDGKVETPEDKIKLARDIPPDYPVVFKASTKKTKWRSFR